MYVQKNGRKLKVRGVKGRGHGRGAAAAAAYIPARAGSSRVQILKQKEEERSGGSCHADSWSGRVDSI